MTTQVICLLHFPFHHKCNTGSLFVTVLPIALPNPPALNWEKIWSAPIFQPRWESHQKPQPLVPDTSEWGVDIHCNLYVCAAMWVCLFLPLSQLEESPRKEILHQFRPDYRSECDQCQKAESIVMRPNGETSPGLFNGNEYTMAAQGRMRGRVGLRESWPDLRGGRDNHTVWERRRRCNIYCVVQGSWQNNRNM